MNEDQYRGRDILLIFMTLVLLTSLMSSAIYVLSHGVEFLPLRIIRFVLEVALFAWLFYRGSQLAKLVNVGLLLLGGSATFIALFFVIFQGWFVVVATAAVAALYLAFGILVLSSKSINEFLAYQRGEGRLPERTSDAATVPAVLAVAADATSNSGPARIVATNPAVVAGAAAGTLVIPRFWKRADGWMSVVSEYLSPILVKEARQALKSKQFIITFSLLLLCGWAWSFLGVAIMGPEIHFSNYSGMMMFMGYEFILLFPLVVVVPFSAYRSLAREWEDGTYEMISISTLKAWQIVGGKLGSAVLQMVVYLSAILPFLAFTNLLRGIDVVTIVYVVFWTVMLCLFNTILCLCVATITRDKIWQIVFSVFLIAVTLGEFAASIGLIVGAFEENVFLFGNWEFWLVTGIFVTAVVAFQALFFLIARARLLFPSQNRSTAIRITMVLHQAILAGWIGWAIIRFGSAPDEVPAVFVFVLAIYWFVMGMFLTGENPQLSQRVKRDLPQSFLGRMFFTWFNPGSGTGYLFVIGNLAGGILLLGVGLVLASFFSPDYLNNWGRDEFLTVGLVSGLALCYLTIYLGMSRLLLLLLRRFADVGVLLSVLINILLYLVGELVPLVVTLLIPGVREETYNILQFPSPGYTLAVAVGWPGSRDVTAVSLLILLIPAAIVFLINLVFAAREIRQFRVVAPKRVQEEESVLHPRREESTYRSPWDEDESAPAT